MQRIVTRSERNIREAARRCRSIAAHAYDNFDETRAAKAVASAAALASPVQIDEFRRATDP